MKTLLPVLLKVWVQQFYQRNAGFFLFLFVVLFGVVQNPVDYHFKLMQGIVSSYATLTIAIAIWLLYACKCAMTVLNSINKEKIWLSQLQAITVKRLSSLLIIIHAFLFSPATVYILFTIGAGVHLHQYFAVIVLTLFLVLVHILSVILYYRSLFNNSTSIPLLKIPAFTYGIRKGFFTFLLWYSFYKGKLKTVAVKFFSFVLLFIPLVWNSDHFELSDFVIFFQISIAAHAVMVYDNVQFLERNFHVLRNIPMPLYKLILLFMTTYMVLLLPESFFLYYYGSKVQLGISVASLLLYYIGQLLLFTALAYEKHQKIESYLLYIGLITVCSLLLTPLKSFGLVGGALIIIAFSLFNSNYYQYEPEYEVKTNIKDTKFN